MSAPTKTPSLYPSASGMNASKSPVPTAARNKHSDMFPAPQWRDVWAAVVFYVHFALFVAVSAYALYAYSKTSPVPYTPENGKLTSIGAISLCLASSTTLALLLTGFALSALRRNPEGMIHASLVFSAVLSGILSLSFFLSENAHGLFGIVFGIIALLKVVYYFAVRSRIPFSAILLRTVCDCLNAYPSMLLVSAGSVFVSIFYLVYWIVTIDLLITVFHVNNSSSADEKLFYYLLIYCCFSMYWTMQVIGNVVQTTIAGVYATYYFLHGTGQAIINPTAGALSRSLTFSFGSICFGSLIVAAIQTVRLVLMSSYDRNSIAGLIIRCILDIIEDLVRYFNYYAYTQVAIYGKSYVQASKDTWELIKSRGIDAIINDNLVGVCTGFCAISILLFTYIATAIISKIVYPDFNQFLMALVAIPTIIIPSVAFKIIGAGSTTIFVCLAEDPAALQRSKPELFTAINSRYSNINI